MMSEASTADGPVRELIRSQLNTEKIKLWLPPYTANDGQKGDAITQLIENYSSCLKLPKDAVETAVEELRQHALQKYSAIQKFKERGIATLKVRLTGNVPSNVDLCWSENEQPVEVSLELSGSDFKQRISELSGVSAAVFKPIANGRVLEDGLSLLQQQISNFSPILFLCLSADEASIIESEAHSSRVAKTRHAAEIVADYDGDDDNIYQLQIADQTGRVIDMPKEEKKALGLAMMLHEKGRSALKRKDISLSLVYLLEADEEFKKCRSSILDYVDNYALLCLDIVWCYLRLQNVSALPDAEMRLRTCESSFKKSYGPNLERLRSVKGGIGKEQALLMRLHLLQAVLAFHQGNNQLCMQRLQQAESELSKLLVDENSMTQVMEMGFSSLEARLGLRAAGGDVERALTHIIEQREEKKKRLKDEREERKTKRLQTKLGKTANGENVNLSFYRMLTSMGFSKGASAEALRQTNNDISNAVEIIRDRPELLDLPDPEADGSAAAAAAAAAAVTDDLIQQVVALGFDEGSVCAALHHFKADASLAVEQLVQFGGLALPEWYHSIPRSQSSNSSATDASSSSLTSPSSESERITNEERVKLIEEEIMPDIPQNEEDHLDLELEDEAAILEEYKARLASVL